MQSKITKQVANKMIDYLDDAYTNYKEEKYQSYIRNKVENAVKDILNSELNAMSEKNIDVEKLTILENFLSQDEKKALYELFNEGNYYIFKNKIDELYYQLKNKNNQSKSKGYTPSGPPPSKNTPTVKWIN